MQQGALASAPIGIVGRHCLPTVKDVKCLTVLLPSPAFQASSPQWASENFRRSEPQAKNRLIVQIIMVRRQAQPALCKNSNLPNQQLSAY